METIQDKEKTGQQKVKKTIKRYQNRKLYDTHQSCYVTLDEIAEMIAQGDDIIVIDNKTKRDITSSTMTQIIFEKQKKSKTLLPIPTLREIIQRGGGSISAFLDVAARAGRGQTDAAKDALNRKFEGGAAAGNNPGREEELQKHVTTLNSRITELEAKLRTAEAALSPKPRQPEITH